MPLDASPSTLARASRLVPGCGGRASPSSCFCCRRCSGSASAISLALRALRPELLSYDDFSGVVKRDFTLATYKALLQPANLDSIWRTLLMACAVTVAAALIAFPSPPISRSTRSPGIKGAALCRRAAAALVSYLVRVCMPGSWCSPREGILGWLAEHLSFPGRSTACSPFRASAAPSLSTAYVGTFIVFVYIWLPYAVLPSSRRWSACRPNLLEASADLGATPSATHRK